MTLCSVLLFLFFLAKIVNTDLTMMIVYGKPASSSSANISTSLTWSECVQQCYKSKSCILAWQNGTNCVNYNYNKMSNVYQTTSVNNSVVAFKVENSEDDCPTGDTPPTFNGTNATGTLYINNLSDSFPMYVYYVIYESGTTWKVSYTVNVSCSNEFTAFIKRSDGTAYCISAWYTTAVKGFLYNTTLTLCKNSSNALASLYYPIDATYLTEYASSMTSLLNNSNSYARIDGIRTAACQSDPTNETCLTVDGFNFTGTPPDNFDNYDWVTTAGAQDTSDSNCIVMVFNGTDAGRTDVRSCGTSSPLQAGMAFCGGPAWIN